MRRRLIAAGVVAACGVVAVAWDESTIPTLSDRIDELPVKTQSSRSYDRDAFDHWVDADGDGCDTRAEVLASESTVDISVVDDCTVRSGEWVSYYDDETFTDASDLDVDHLVPLAEAWRSGAYSWDAAKREKYANDLEHDATLVAVSASSNRSKSDKDPSDWLPEHDRCRYVIEWVDVKREWKLSVDEAEVSALHQAAQSC